MSRTRKDAKQFKFDHWMNIAEPSWWHKMCRREERELVRQEMRNRREPEPRYYRDKQYWW